MRPDVHIEVESKSYQSEAYIVSELPKKEVYTQLHKEEDFYKSNSITPTKKSSIPPVGSKFVPPHTNLRGDSPFGIEYLNI